MGWYAVSALGFAVAGCAVLLLAANLYVQSPTVQQRIRQALAATLRMPVRVQKTTVTFWEGLRIDGIAAQADPAVGNLPGKPGNRVTAASFRVRFSLRSLLWNRRLVLSEVLLDRPGVVWGQDPAGRWQFPAAFGSLRSPRPDGLAEDAPAPPAPSTPPEPPAGAEALPPAVPPAPVAADPAPRSRERKLENFVLSVGRFRLRHGEMEFLNKKRSPVGRFEEVNLDGHLDNPGHADGTVWFDRAGLPRLGLRLANFRSRFAYDHQDGLALTGGRAGLAGGVVQTNFHLHTGEPDSPFALDCRMENVSLGQFVKEAGSRLALVEGTLEGSLSASGRSDDPASRAATGRFELVNARVRDLPLFQMAGDVLGIADLSHLQFKTARLDYTLEGNTVRVSPLVLVSHDLQIRAEGDYHLDEDRLDLRARLTVDSAVARQLPSFATEKFRPCGSEAPGSAYLDFDVKGPLGKPSTNLYKQVVPHTVGGLLEGLFHSKPKKNRLPSIDPEPTPAEADTP